MKARFVGRDMLVILILALVSSACGGSPSSDQAQPERQVASSDEDVISSTEDAAPSEEQVGPTEGEVVSSDGSATLHIPEGALPEGMDLDDLSVIPLEREASSTDSTGGDALASYALEPSGLTFLEPARLSVTFPMPTEAHTLTVRLTSEDGEFEFLEPSELSVDETGESLTTVVPIPHFSRVDIDQWAFWEIRFEVPDQITRGEPFDLELTITRNKDLLVDNHPAARSRMRFVGEDWDLQGKLSAKQPPGWGLGATPQEVGAPDELTAVNGNSISFTREFTCVSDRAYIRYSGTAFFKAETFFEGYEDLKKTYDRYWINVSSTILIWCDHPPEPAPSAETVGTNVETRDDPGGHAPFVGMPGSVDLRVEPAEDTFWGGDEESDDTSEGDGDSDDPSEGDGGSDVIWGGAGDDVIFGGGGNDDFYYEEDEESEDTFGGSDEESDDDLWGGADEGSDDNLWGGDGGSDVIFGGGEPWVDVQGVLLPDGNFQADGIGTVAGFPNIRAQFEGTFVDGNLDGVYSLGGDGGLPGGAAITFTVQGAVIAPPPPEIVDETPQGFFDQYSQAMQTGNTGFLLDRLHPVVIDMYGAPACQNRLEELLNPTLQAQVTGVEGPTPWLFERDGQVHEIRRTHNVDVTITVAGEPSDRQTHLEQIDGLQRWFTDCGDPLP